MTEFVTLWWFDRLMEQIEMAFDEVLDFMPPPGPRRYHFDKNALVIDFSDRKLLFGLWDRLHGFWSVDANGRQVEEKVPYWRPLNDQGVWSLDDDAPCQDASVLPGSGQQNLRREANAAFVAYFDSVPKGVRRLVGGLEGNQWLTLDLIWQVPEFATFLDDEIHEGRIQYIFACCSLADAENMSRADRREFATSMMRTKRPDFLSRLSGVNCSKSSVRTLYKLGQSPCSSASYSAVLAASRMPGPSKVFAHTARIKPRGIEDWLSLPAPVRLPNVLRVIIEDPDVSYIIDELLLRIPILPPEMLRRMGQSLSKVRTPRETLEWCVRWEERVLKQAIFPKPPLEECGPLRPLTNAEDMRREGREMRNCLGDLIHAVLLDQTYFYHWDGPLPATVMLETCSESGWYVRRILGPDNDVVSDRLVREITRHVNQQLGAPFPNIDTSKQPEQEVLFSCLSSKNWPETRQEIQAAGAIFEA